MRDKPEWQLTALQAVWPLAPHSAHILRSSGSNKQNQSHIHAAPAGAATSLRPLFLSETANPQRAKSSEKLAMLVKNKTKLKDNTSRTMLTALLNHLTLSLHKQERIKLLPPASAQINAAFMWLWY